MNNLCTNFEQIKSIKRFCNRTVDRPQMQSESERAA